MSYKPNQIAEAKLLSEIGMNVITIETHFTISGHTRKSLIEYFAYLLQVTIYEITDVIFNAFIETKEDLEHYLDILGYVDTKGLQYA